MRKFILATTFLCGMSGYALAADAVVYEPAPVEVTPIFIWTGGYVGLHAGYAWGRESDNLSEFILQPEVTGVTEADRFDVDGFVGGLHAGYNWQSGSFVYGVEGDIDYTNVKGDHDFDIGGGTGNLSLNSDWQGSVRLRAGYAVDTWLFYGTGGVAFGRAELEASASGYDTVSDKNTHVGWTLGAGVEKAFTPNWVGRLEARYTDFGSENYNLGTDFGESVESDWNQTAVTVGLSYKF